MDIARDLMLAQQALATLFSVTNKLQMRGDKQLRDITLRQMLAIPALLHAPDGKATITHIARHMGTTKQNAKQIVAAMARKGYLSVAPSGQDRRAVNVNVTPEGERAFRVCAERVDEFMANIFRTFGTEELEAFCSLLQKLYRFDGAAPEVPDEHLCHSGIAADEVLRHHQRFTRLRANPDAKESE